MKRRFAAANLRGRRRVRGDAPHQTGVAQKSPPPDFIEGTVSNVSGKPKSKHWELIYTCFATHHLQFDKKGVLWMSNDGQVIGWLDPSKYVEGRPETAGDAQGWSRRMVDTNGDGTADTPATGSYGVIPNDVDGSVWSSSGGGGVQGNTGRGNIERFDPATGKHEAYHPPKPGHGPRGIDSDSLILFNQTTKKFTKVRIPYPLNAYMRGLDRRIDDPRAGWKGRGLWMNEGLDPVLHNEVQHGWVGHIQMRPNPLAR